jgi:CRISPR-associated endonuclease Cas1
VGLSDFGPDDVADAWEEFGPEDIDEAPGPPITCAEQDTAIEANRRAYSTPEGATSSVWVVDGYGLSVKVRNGCLQVCDGVPAHPRVRVLSRAQVGNPVRRVLVTGAGFVTTEAMTWCHLQGLPLVVARTGPHPTMMGAPVLFDHGGLRYAQALSASLPTALPILKWLLDRRLVEQAALAERMGRPDRAEVVQFLRRPLIAATNVAEAMVVEARAADHYWACWEEVRLRFNSQDRQRVPEHWPRFGGRRSPLLVGKATNRHAATPLNALLNFGYKLTEAEAVIALMGVGLDPAIGWGHSPRLGRPAAALDLMEVARSTVEEVVWRLAEERTFSKADFREDHTGQVWLRHPFAHHFADRLMPAIAEHLAPVAEELAQKVANTVPSASQALELPTLLTGGKRKVARRSPPRDDRRYSRPSRATKDALGRLRLWNCPGCGAEVANPRHVLCAACQVKAGHTPNVRRNRGQAIATRKAALKASADSLGFPADKDWYRANILPRLASHKLSELAACGISKGYASYVRSGKYVPNVALWPALARLAGVELPTSHKP